MERSKSDSNRNGTGGETLPLSQIVDRVYTLESSRGKYDGCRKIGKINGFGFMVHGNSYVCFDSYLEVRQKVENWFTNHLKEMDLAESLCYWNTGLKTEDCPYFQKFLTIN